MAPSGMNATQLVRLQLRRAGIHTLKVETGDAATCDAICMASVPNIVGNWNAQTNPLTALLGGFLAVDKWAKRATGTSAWPASIA